MRISGSGANEIDTASGNLILDAASNIVQVTTNLTVSGNTASTSKTTGALTVGGGVGIGGKLHVGDDVIAFSSSDINLKENLVVIPDALSKVGLITGYTFDWKNVDVGSYGTDGKDTGIIAQDVESLGLPGITTTRDNGTKAVRYDRLIPVLINAIKELEARVATLESS